MTGAAAGPAGPAAAAAAARGLRRVGAATLMLEAVVLLLALLAVYALHRRLSATDLGVLLGLTALLIVVAVGLRLPGGPLAGAAVQLLVIGGGVLVWPLYVLGVLFGLLWVGYLRLRRRFPPPGGQPSRR